MRSRSTAAERQVDAVEIAGAEPGQRERGLPQGLAGKRAGIGDGAAEERVPLDENHTLAEEGGGQGPLLPGRAGADDDQVVTVGGHGRNSSHAGGRDPFWTETPGPPPFTAPRR
jgi:hypothetical protein